MGVLSKGTDFTNGDQVTDTSLDNLVDNATFTTSAVDLVSTDIGGSGSIIVRDGGITTAKLADSTSAATGVTAIKIASSAVTAAKIATDAVTTVKILDANVTEAKIATGAVTVNKLGTNAVTTVKIADANVTTAKIADANVTFAKLTDIIDDDTMATATATTLATSESIKAYADGTSSFTTEDGQSAGYQIFPSGLKMAWGDSTAALDGTITFPAGVGFTVAPTIQISYNKPDSSSTYYGAQVINVTTTNFAYAGTYGNLYGPRYLAIGI
jgi:hypothetical protein